MPRTTDSGASGETPSRANPRPRNKRSGSDIYPGGCLSLFLIVAVSICLVVLIIWFAEGMRG